MLIYFRNFDYEREKKNNKNTLVFQPLVQDTFSSSETDDEEFKKIPNKVIKRRDESMETQPQSGEEEEEEEEDEDDEDEDDDIEVKKLIKLNQKKFKLNNKINRVEKQKLLSKQEKKENKRRSGSSGGNKKKIIKQEDGFVVKYADTDEEDEDELTSDEEIIDMAQKQQNIKIVKKIEVMSQVNSSIFHID